jgi:transaldolase
VQQENRKLANRRAEMEIFVDSASATAIEKWLKMGVADGVTTNPSIMLKDGVYDMERGAREIAALINPRPLNVEVTTNDLDEMLTQARLFASWAPNIVIKIPQETQDGAPCYGVMHQLETEGIKVNATVALSLGQVILAAKAGAAYISIFTGRVGDEGGNPAEVIKNSVDWLERWHFKSKIIVGSIRSVADVLQAAIAGAHIITIPPEFITRMADHKYTRETVRQFVADAKEALNKMAQAKV